MADGRKPPSDSARHPGRRLNRVADIALQAPVVSSFKAQVIHGCRALVLGTMPGVRSLAMQQFYAHPRNLFWPLMGEFFGAGLEIPYGERLARLQASGVGLWDVLQQCERAGSLDDAIRIGSEVPNDLAGLLEEHPTIGAIVLNGTKAADVFLRRIAPRIGPSRLARLAILPMPSTSPANASIALQGKRDRWSGLPNWLSGEHPSEPSIPHV